MKSFVVHLSDPTGIDEQSLISVRDQKDLGDAVRMAIDEIAEKSGGSLSFPLFIDVHPVAAFQERAWMYPLDQGKSSAVSVKSAFGAS